jgi:AcrR family transcriptional regulator
MTEMRGIRNEMVEFRRARILDAASQLFFQKGFSGTTIDDIAGRLGVTKPFIYNCFTSKAELLTEVCNRTTAFAADLAQEALKAKGPATDRLRRFARDLTLRVIEGRIYLAVLFREEKHLAPESLAALKRDRKRFNAALSALLEEGREAGDFHFGNIEIALQAITGMTTWIFSWYQPSLAISAEQLADEMGELVLQTAGARASPA